jgi:hypothetical protein
MLSDSAASATPRPTATSERNSSDISASPAPPGGRLVKYARLVRHN